MLTLDTVDHAEANVLGADDASINSSKTWLPKSAPGAEIDRASSETDRAIELRARDRQRKLISKIDAALQRIEDDTYGYCEETGEPIR